MASKKLEFKDDFQPCRCKSNCNRPTKTRKCRCQAAERYCTPLCRCGTDKEECCNKYGKGGHLDMVFGVPTEQEQEIDEPVVLLAGNENGHVLVQIDRQLNRSMQEEADAQFETHGIHDRSWESAPMPQNAPAQAHSVTEGNSMIGGLSLQTLRGVLNNIMKDHPHLMSYILGCTNPEQPPSPPEGDAGDWCHCGMCVPMDNPEEQKCCRTTDGECILVRQATGHAISIVVLNVQVLQAAIRNRNDLFALQDDIHSLRSLRHAAYRQYVLWRFGHLGAGNRVVIPSCVVNRIRTLFPAPDGQYTGFRLGRFN